MIEKFIRINKYLADQFYDVGGTIFIIPCKIHPNNELMYPAEISKDIISSLTNLNSYEKFLRAYIAQNCNTETGLYLAFYIELVDYDLIQEIKKGYLKDQKITNIA